MKRWLYNFIVCTLALTMIIGMPVLAKESGEWKVLSGNGEVVLFTGTKEECDTFCDYISGSMNGVMTYKNCGSGEYKGNVICLSYKFGNDGIVKFDFEYTNKMTWIDGSKWDITYTGSMNYDYVISTYHYTDDAIMAFCPEFANTHSLIPSGVPANFESVLIKAKEQRNKRLGIVSESVATDEEQPDKGIETFEAFNEIDYANRYEDVKTAIGMDKDALWNHYCTFGKNEGRIAVFDKK